MKLNICFASLSIWNHDCREPTIDELLSLGADDYVVAVGETGLDYYRNDEDIRTQKKRLIAHIEVAKELSKPLIIHCREAAEDLINVLMKERADKIGGVMHCFVEDWKTAQAAIDLGFSISLSGIVTFKNATQLKEIAKNLPLESILVETDSPWLAPIPYRGKKNEPAYVRKTAEYIAGLREESIIDFASATTANFYRLFPCAKKRSEID
jgi:TatD DNase family protein